MWKETLPASSLQACLASQFMMASLSSGTASETVEQLMYIGSPRTTSTAPIPNPGPGPSPDPEPAPEPEPTPI